MVGHLANGEESVRRSRGTRDPTGGGRGATALPAGESGGPLGDRALPAGGRLYA